MRDRIIQLPTENWVETGHPNKDYDEAYMLGYIAAHMGQSLDDNPYEPSNHERDTTYSDRMNYHWYSGFSDYKYGT